MNSAKRSKVIVGMSGGVDSSVAALLLLQQGYAVEGLFMKNWDEDDGTEYCTAQADYDDAAIVAEKLGIELHSANFAAEYWDGVFEEFLREYRAGRTPNPDVLCNREIKFNVFIDYAQTLGADSIATGHYARSRMTDHTFELHKSADQNKDQTYFLNAVPIDQLSRCLFPLGDLAKSEVRNIAKRTGLHNHQRKDSTGICFIGERRFRDFLARYVSTSPGPMVGTDGRVLGQHMGLAYYTIGQRQGLGVGGKSGRPEAPWYVVAKDPGTNRLTVSQDPEQLLSDWLSTTAINWLISEPQLPLRCSARVRYRQADQNCHLFRRADGGYWIDFEKPQRAVTPGQYVCLYSGTQCLGGGVIEGNGRVATQAARQ